MENINRTLAASLKSTDTAPVAKALRILLPNQANWQVWQKQKTTKAHTHCQNTGAGKIQSFVCRDDPSFFYIWKTDSNLCVRDQLWAGVAQKDTAKVNAFFKRPEIASIIPQTYKFMWGVKPADLGVANTSKIF